MRHVSAAVKVGILALLMVIGSYAVWKSIGSKPSGDDNYVLYAKFKDASGLPVGSAVMVAGLPIGEISDLSIEGRYAKIKMRVRDDVKVWSNAVVMKKSTSLLGSYYLEIDPGAASSIGAGKQTLKHDLLKSGDNIKHVVEATSPSQLMTRIEQSIPNVDAVLKAVQDLANDLRRIVNGPLDSIASRIDQLVQKESSTVSEILARTNRTIARIERITQDVRGATKGADKKVDRLLSELNTASKEATKLMKVAQTEVEQTGKKVREKLDLADELLTHSGSIAKKIDSDTGTLGKLVNDPAIADNIEEITEDAKNFFGTLFRMQTYVGLRTEYNFFSQLARAYVTVEVATRPDKFYYIELEKGPRGDYPTVTLEYDPRIDDMRWVRRIKIEDQIRFTFQFGKRYHWASFRYGIKESTGGIGVDFHVLSDKLKFSVDVFDMNFDRFPRLKVAAAYLLFRHLYIIAGADELLNKPETLAIDTGNEPSGVPGQFESFRYGRDYFFGAMLRFNDHDLTQLLFIGGNALTGAAN